MSTYSYTISTDFSSGVNPHQFHNEIEDSAISSVFYGVDINDDTIDVNFESALSMGDQTILDNLVASHVPSYAKPKQNFFIVPVRKNNINSTDYFLTATFKYPGSINVGLINYAEIIGYMDSGITSYDVKVINNENDLVIVEKLGITNTILAETDLGTILNVPNTESILELHVRKNGGKTNDKITIENLNIYYNN